MHKPAERRKAIAASQPHYVTDAQAVAVEVSAVFQLGTVTGSLSAKVCGLN
jgi:hypothetical protein